jgi:hypothetical protein
VCYLWLRSPKNLAHPRPCGPTRQSTGPPASRACRFAPRWRAPPAGYFYVSAQLPSVMFNVSFPARPHLIAVPRRLTFAARGLLPFASSPSFGLACAGAAEPLALHPRRRVAVGASWWRSVLARSAVGGFSATLLSFAGSAAKALPAAVSLTLRSRGRCAIKPRSAPELRR